VPTIFSLQREDASNLLISALSKPKLEFYKRWNMRAPLFFAVAALAVNYSLAFSNNDQIEPSNLQMESAFTRFLYGEATAESSRIKFARFEKESCKPILVAPGHNCTFTYVTKTPLDVRGTPIGHLSSLSAGGTLAGRFFDEDGQLKFEMIIG
jgi:hypothetical protein